MRRLSDKARAKMAEGGRKGGMKKMTPETSIRWTNPDMVIGQADAIAMGFTVYRTGKPCKRGHTGWRRTATTQCIDCWNELQQARYQRSVEEARHHRKKVAAASEA